MNFKFITLPCILPTPKQLFLLTLLFPIMVPFFSMSPKLEFPSLPFLIQSAAMLLKY